MFTAALAKGVPAIVLNDAKGTLPGVVYVGPDAEAIGQTAADYIAQQLPDGGKVAMIEGDPGSSNALNRGKGFKEGLAKHPNLNLVASQTAKWDTNQAQTDRDRDAHRQPGHQGVLLAERHAWRFGVQAAVDAKGLTGQVIIVGHRRDSAGEEADRRRHLTATVSERPTTEGAAGVQTALWLLDGK